MICSIRTVVIDVRDADILRPVILIFFPILCLLRSRCSIRRTDVHKLPTNELVSFSSWSISYSRSILNINSNIDLKRFFISSINMECFRSVITEPTDMRECRVFNGNIFCTKPYRVFSFLYQIFFVSCYARINYVAIFIQIIAMCILNKDRFITFVNKFIFLGIRYKHLKPLSCIDGCRTRDVNKSFTIRVLLHNPIVKSITSRFRRRLYGICYSTVNILTIIYDSRGAISHLWII